RPHRVSPSFPTRRSSDLSAIRYLRRAGLYASRCRENVRGAGNQSVPCVLSGLRLKSLSILRCWNVYFRGGGQRNQDLLEQRAYEDRKSTRLNSSHVSISY